MLGKTYSDSVVALVQRVAEAQFPTISKAAALIYPSLKNGGLLHMFGCGHSHILCEECFYRAGGLVPVNPIFETSTMLHEGAVKSSRVERMSGYAELIIDNYNVQPGETMIVFSTSGINALPIEMAQQAKKRGLHVVAFSSQQYSHAASRHDSGKRLPDFADLLVDTSVPQGDAIVHLPASKLYAVPGSTVVNATLVNMLIAEILELYEKDGIIPPVYISGNIEGGFEKNQENINAYRSRIKSL